MTSLVSYLSMMRIGHTPPGDDLPDIEVIVEMDYPPDGDCWNAKVLQPQDWTWLGQGSTADEVCDAAYTAATRKFGDVMMLYRYTDRSTPQCIIEDSTRSEFLNCEICNPPAEDNTL